MLPKCALIWCAGTTKPQCDEWAHRLRLPNLFTLIWKSCHLEFHMSRTEGMGLT
jgi:hypothetical protein